MTMAADDIVTGLDIGSSKVCVIIAELNSHGRLDILGVGRSASDGLRAGVVVNIESTLRSVTEAVEAAEQMAGREVQSMHIGIAGSHIEGINSRGVVAVSSRGREITQVDVERVTEAARAIVLPMDREIFHVIPQEYTVDSTNGIKNPIDMIGVRLEAEMHVITGSVTAAQNLVKCVNRAGFGVESITLSTLAAGRAILSKDEMAMGCLLIDIGGGTSDFILYKEGAPMYTSVIPIGGQTVSSDVSIILRTTIENAEILKVQHGSCWMPALNNPEEPALLPGFIGRSPIKVSRGQLCEFIQPRMTEILSLVKEKVEKESRLKSWGVLGAGVVLTGGTAMMPGCAELAAQIFGVQAHVGVPLNLGGVVHEFQRPDTSTAVGLALEAIEGLGPVIQTGGTSPDGRTSNTMEKVKHWFKQFF